MVNGCLWLPYTSINRGLVPYIMAQWNALQLLINRRSTRCLNIDPSSEHTGIFSLNSAHWGCVLTEKWEGSLLKAGGFPYSTMSTETGPLPSALTRAPFSSDALGLLPAQTIKQGTVGHLLPAAVKAVLPLKMLRAFIRLYWVAHLCILWWKAHWLTLNMMSSASSQASHPATYMPFSGGWVPVFTSNRTDATKTSAARSTVPFGESPVQWTKSRDHVLSRILEAHSRESSAPAVTCSCVYPNNAAG